MQVNASQPQPGSLWLDESQTVSIDELIAISSLSIREVIELVDAGALVPTDAGAAAWTFHAGYVVTLRKASRLRDDLELDIHALALALTLLEQIRALEAELSHLRAQHTANRFY